MRDCPQETPQPLKARLPPIECFCVGCFVDHFPKEFPTKPSIANSQGVKTGLNYIGVVPFPSNSESESKRTLLNIATKAQARQNAETQIEASKRLKKRGRQKTRSKGSKKAKGEPKKLTEDQEKLVGETPIVVSKPKQRDEGVKSTDPKLRWICNSGQSEQAITSGFGCL